MIRRREPWNSQPAIGKSAHILERTGLALTGASCGLFVAAHVGRADIDLIGSVGVVLGMMLYGAAGFYLGIDLPQVPPDHHMHLPVVRAPILGKVGKVASTVLMQFLTQSNGTRAGSRGRLRSRPAMSSAAADPTARPM
jgi:hypothetical protein